VNFVDVLVLAWLALSAAHGARRGLTLQLFSLLGLVGGAFLGARLGPHLLPGGATSPWVPLAGLVGALVGALLLETAAHAVRSRLSQRPVEVVDMAGGIVLGTLLGLGFAWLLAALALQQPELGLRRDVQHSAILPALVRTVSPQSVLSALNRFDPLPFISAFPDRGLPPPDPSVEESPGAQAAKMSVVKIQGTSCGLGIEGSGWVVRPGIVATNAHVIAGESDTRVLVLGQPVRVAIPIYVDRNNDAALLRVYGLTTTPLRVAPSPSAPEQVVLLGYPDNGRLTAVAGTAGPPAKVFTRDAYGDHVLLRTVVPLRGRVREGDSGGPVVDAKGRVVTMMFAATQSRQGGFGVPLSAIMRGLRNMHGRVSSGPCVG